eukprot:2953437-Pleurochrysis_carterae.AAC.2
MPHFRSFSCSISQSPYLALNGRGRLNFNSLHCVQCRACSHPNRHDAGIAEAQVFDSLMSGS